MNFIPLSYYISTYYIILLIIIIFSLFIALSPNRYQNVLNKFSSYFLFIYLMLIIGLRPISYAFGDMGNYARYFNDMKNYGYISNTGDVGFYGLMRFLSNFVSDNMFFLVLAFLYIFPLYHASKKLFPNNYYFSFLFLIASFSFFTYGTNGLRNGIATSIFILAFTYKNNKLLLWALLVLSWSFHSSLIMPIIALMITSIYNKTKFFLGFWFASIFLSITTGAFWEDIFLKLGLTFSNNVGDYFNNKEMYQDSFSSTGFRWDFLIYSSFPIIIGMYFIFVKKINDKEYTQLLNIYLLTNSVWILVIRASFTNRFAYLSWFLMGLIVIYPLLKKQYWKRQYLKIWYLLIIYYSFTFIMNVFVYKH